jgi:hypothetical protein
MLSTNVDINVVFVLIVLANNPLRVRLFVQNVLPKELSVRTLNSTPLFPVLSTKLETLILEAVIVDMYGLFVGASSPFVEVINM